MKRYRAFTLIELLVVVTIIAMLIAMLLPSLENARDVARQVACLSNERSIGQALYLYGNDHDRLPSFVGGTYGFGDGGHYDVYRPPGPGGVGWTGLGLLYSDNSRPNDGPWEDYARAPYLTELRILQCPSSTAALFDYETQRRANTSLRVPYVYRNPIRLLAENPATGMIEAVDPDPGITFNGIMGSGLAALSDNPIGTDPAFAATFGHNQRAHQGYNILQWSGDARFVPAPVDDLFYGWGNEFNRLWTDARY